MCEFECFFSLLSTSTGGVPSTLCIFVTWSSSLVPGKSGYNESTSKKTQPTPHMSIL